MLNVIYHGAREMSIGEGKFFDRDSCRVVGRGVPQGRDSPQRARLSPAGRGVCPRDRRRGGRKRCRRKATERGKGICSAALHGHLHPAASYDDVSVVGGGLRAGRPTNSMESSIKQKSVPSRTRFPTHLLQYASYFSCSHAFTSSTPSSLRGNSRSSTSTAAS